MKEVLAVVLAGGKGSRLEPLTRDRAKPAVPFGGIYRIIDFTLSNCLNSGVRRMLVLTQYKAMSLDRHIKLGWRHYLCRELGEFIDVVPPQQRIDEQWYQGTADAVYQNIYTLEKERPRVRGHPGRRPHLQDGLRQAGRRITRRTNADLTIAALRVTAKEAARQFGVMQVDGDSRVVGFEEKPAEPKTIPGDPEHCLASMGIYVFNARFLFEQLCHDATLPDSAHDFGRNIIPSIIATAACLAFPFRDENRKRDAYWRDVGTIDAYYEANMELTGGRSAAQHVRRPLADPHLSAESAAAEVRVQIERSVRRGARQHRLRRGDHLRRPGDADDRRPANARQQLRRGRGLDPVSRVNIGRNAKIRRAIIDKGVSIPEGFRVGFDAEEDEARGFTVSARRRGRHRQGRANRADAGREHLTPFHL